MAKQSSEVNHLGALDRAIAQAIGDSRTVGREDDPACKQFPELWRWLSTINVGRDRVKAPALVTVRLGPEGVLVSLTDRDLGVSLDATCGNLSEVWAALESALTGSVPPVRSWGKKEPNLRKRKSGN